MTASAILFLHSQILPAKVLDVTEAVKSGYLSVTAAGKGGHTGECLKLKLQSKSKKKLAVRIPAGQIFEPQDSNLQVLMISREETFVLEPGRSRITYMYGLCIRAHKSSPSEGSEFSLGPMAEGNLLTLANYLSENKLYQHPSAQYAVWSVSDEERLEGIGDQELTKFVATLLNKPMPEYHIQYVQPPHDRLLPGQPANWREAMSLNGLFYYTLDADQKVDFGLYDEQGELAAPFFKNRIQKRGYHKFRFNFEIRGLKKGKYFVRLISKNGVLKELPVEF